MMFTEHEMREHRSIGFFSGFIVGFVTSTAMYLTTMFI